jgi:hypothetical protein
MKNLIYILIIVYLIYLLYPFYQRYWASITYGETKDGKRFVKNIEGIAYLTFKDAETLATELKKPASERKAPDILDFKQYTGGLT